MDRDKSRKATVLMEKRRRLFNLSLSCLAVALAAGLGACARNTQVSAATAGAGEQVTVGVMKVGRKTLQRQITLSSELVPFQEIDVYAKESGYVKQLLVDYGTRVQKGQLLAVLEIPELEMLLAQDKAAIQNMANQVTHAEHELNRVEAQHQVVHLQFQRLQSVANAKPGLVAQQEVDDAQGKDLASEAQIEARKSALEAVQSQLVAAQAKQQHDQVLFDYSRITAPFAGVVTQRYANLGTLLQAGTTSSTQAMPLVKLSEDDLFRLVIPVPESYVRYIRIGDPVEVHVAALNRNLPGKVTRFSVDVKEDTRTMHTEVDVSNPDHVLIPGVYAEATLTLERRDKALAIPLQAVNQEGTQSTVYVVAAGGKLEDRPVRLGLQTPSDAEVVSGLAEGDEVVVSDRSSLKPGEAVRPQVVEAVDDQAPKQ